MTTFPRHKRLTTAQRRAFYDAAKGNNEFPACNICGLPVEPWQAWDESHMPMPRALDGTETGVAHKRCNATRWAQVEAPMLAKGRHQYDMARGIKASRQPFRRKELPMKRTVDGRVVDRKTGEEWNPKR